MKRAIAVVCLSVACMLMIACDSPEKISRDAIAGAKGVLETAQAKYHAQCVADVTGQPCILIHKAIAAENLAIDALEEYCGGATAPGKQRFLDGGVCSPDKSIQPKLELAVRNLNQVIADVKGVIQ